VAKTLKIACDGCGDDLTTTGNCVDYRLALLNETIPTRGGFVTMMVMYPAIDDGDKYFCDLRCLDHWRDRLRYEATLWREFHESCVTERSGNCTSYRHIPHEEREAKSKEIKAAALEKFPVHRASTRNTQK
jgi:hypothetical protein